MDHPFWTIITGVLVFVIAQTAKAIMVDPAMEQRRILGEIDYNLTYLAQWYANPPSDRQLQQLTDAQRAAHERAGDTLRQLASRLAAATRAIVGYSIWELTTLVPPREDVAEAIGDLIFISNSTYRASDELPERGERPSDYADRVRTRLARRPFLPFLQTRLQQWKEHAWKTPDDGRAEGA